MIKAVIEILEETVEELNKNPLFKQIYETNYILKNLMDAKTMLINMTEENSVCPICGNELIKRTGKLGVFYGCVNYPRCNFTSDSLYSKDIKKGLKRLADKILAGDDAKRKDKVFAYKK